MSKSHHEPQCQFVVTNSTHVQPFLEPPRNLSQKILDFGQDPTTIQGRPLDMDWLKSSSDASLDLGFDLDEFYPEDEESMDQEDTTLPLQNLNEIEELVQKAELLVKHSVALNQRTRSMEFWEDAGDETNEGIPFATSIAEYSHRKCFTSTPLTSNSNICPTKSRSSSKKQPKSKKCIIGNCNNNSSTTDGNPVIVIGKNKLVGSCGCPTTMDGAVGGTCRCEVFEAAGESDIVMTPLASCAPGKKGPKKHSRVRQWVRAHNQNGTTSVVSELIADQKVSLSSFHYSIIKHFVSYA